MRFKGKAQPDQMTLAPLSPPDRLHLTHNQDLVFRGAVRYQLSGRKYMPTLEEIMSINPEWEHDILVMDEFIEWATGEDGITWR